MYSWPQYASAMKKIDKSKANPRTPRAWAKFPITELPVNEYRKGQIIRAALNREHSKQFEDNGYRQKDGKLISYDEFLVRYGSNKKSWKSYASQIKSIHILDNRWFYVSGRNKSGNYDGFCLFYFKPGERKLGRIYPLEFLHQIFQTIGKSGETDIWRYGFPDKEMMEAYKITDHGDNNFLWSPEKETYTRLNDVKIIAETVYRKFKRTTDDNIIQLWGKGNNEGILTNLMEIGPSNNGFSKWVFINFNALQNIVEVVIPPRTEWIINYHRNITSAVKT
jgi:hypothetical protein